MSIKWNSDEYPVQTESLLGVDIFKTQDGEFIGESVEYSQAEFLLPSLKKYDGKSISVMNDWIIKVWGGEEDGDNFGEVIAEFNIMDVPDFRKGLREVLSKYDD
jgi:hypothetical protein